MHKRSCFLFFALFITITLSSQAQIHEPEDFAVPKGFYFEPKDRTIRAFLSNFNFGFSIGYGATFYTQKLDQFSIIQQPDNGPVIFTGTAIPGDSIQAIDYWYNRLNYRGISYGGGDFAIGGDTTGTKYKSLGHSIPATFSIHYDFKNYKIGAGATLEYHIPGTFKPDQFSDRLGTIEPDFSRAFFTSYYGIIGARIVRYWEYLAGIDARIGILRFDKNFDKSVIDQSLFINVGFPIERQFSEYFRVFVRPSFDYKSYTVNIQETSTGIPTSMNALKIEFGIFYRLPDLPKCFLKKCRTQVNHMHGEYQYRSRVHPFYKYQNPHHGQNYPVLIKYKGKNKKKLMPY